MTSTKRQARLAGLLWFLAAVTGGFGLIYIRSKVLVIGDAAATAAHKEVHKQLATVFLTSIIMSIGMWGR